MTTNHTPGPWHVGMRPGPIIYGPQGEQVANLHVAMVDQEENKANARLIAQAPALLEALEELLETAEQFRLAFGHINLSQETISKARAVIAAVKGGGL